MLPERRPLAGVVPRQQQRPRGALAKSRREQCRAADLLGHDRSQILGIEEKQFGPGWLLIGVGDAGDDPVIARHRATLDAVAVADSSAERQRPRSMNLHAVGGMKNYAPVPELVAEPFDHERAVGWHVPRRCLLIGDERDEVVRGATLEARGCGARLCIRHRQRSQFARECADRGTEFGRASDAVAPPERHLARLAERGRDEHAVVGDVFDPPTRRSEREHVTDSGLVDHLLVELADTTAGSLRRVGAHHEYGEQPAVGDGSAARNREALRSGAASDGALHTVPDDAWSQFGELV